jgi:4-aminobutyrate aminotransferase/(S)-3-amino-2-methylpropionate transaminase
MAEKRVVKPGHRGRKGAGTGALANPKPPPISELEALRDRHLTRAAKLIFPIFIESASGSRVRDTDGKEYIDLTGGIGTLTAGHLPKEVVKAIAAQLEKHAHVASLMALNEPYLRVLERLAAIAPKGMGSRSSIKGVLMNSGAEAVENAVKFARAHTKKSAVLAFHGSFHGRTLMTLALTGKTHPLKTGFGPYPPEAYHAPYAYCYRRGCEPGGGCVPDHLAKVEDVIHAQVNEKNLAAILVEPILGEGGIVVPPKGFIKGLREVCDRLGAVLIADEIQCGLGRTGKWWAVEHDGVAPDLVCTAKALGGGLPLSGVFGRGEIVDAPQPGGVGSTFGGNPVACAAALAHLDIIKADMGRARTFESSFMKVMRPVMADAPVVGDVRGRGAMLGVELVRDRGQRTPGTEEATACQQWCREAGVMVLTAGSKGDVIRLLPSLNMRERDWDQGLRVLAGALERTSRGTTQVAGR